MQSDVHSQHPTTSVEGVKQRNVGASGLKVSELGLGTPTEPEIISAFLDAGGTLIDVSEGADLSGFSRRDLVLTAASGVDPAAPLGQRVDCSRRNLIRQLDDLLEQLRTDHLDLWSVGHFDPHTPPEEVAATLQWAVDSGRVRYAGVRGYRGWQLAVTPGVVAAAQEYSLLQRDAEEELIPAASYLGVGVIAGAPLARGVLAGRTGRAEAHTYLSTKTDTVLEAASTAAAGLGLSSAAVALAWVREREGIDAVTVGVSNAAQLRELTDSLGTALPPTIHQALDDVSR